MENIWLFLGTVAVYFGIWRLFDKPNGISQYLTRIGLIMALSVPLNINGNVFTVIGNAVSEKSVYAIASLYQHAGNDALTWIGITGYQRAGEKSRAFGVWSELKASG